MVTCHDVIDNNNNNKLTRWNSMRVVLECVSQLFYRPFPWMPCKNRSWDRQPPKLADRRCWLLMGSHLWIVSRQDDYAGRQPVPAPNEFSLTEASMIIDTIMYRFQNSIPTRVWLHIITGYLIGDWADFDGYLFSASQFHNDRMLGDGETVTDAGRVE